MSAARSLGPAGSLRGYLELVRPPNVATAVADVLAGYAIAGLGHPSRLAWLLLATAALYAGGIVFNDYFDRALDAAERARTADPQRPCRATVGGGLRRHVAAGWDRRRRDGDAGGGFDRGGDCGARADV